MLARYHWSVKVAGTRVDLDDEGDVFELGAWNFLHRSKDELAIIRQSRHVAQHFVLKVIDAEQDTLGQQVLVRKLALEHIRQRDLRLVVAKRVLLVRLGLAHAPVEVLLLLRIPLSDQLNALARLDLLKLDCPSSFFVILFPLREFQSDERPLLDKFQDDGVQLG